MGNNQSAKKHKKGASSAKSPHNKEYKRKRDETRKTDTTPKKILKTEQTLKKHTPSSSKSKENQSNTSITTSKPKSRKELFVEDGDSPIKKSVATSPSKSKSRHSKSSKSTIYTSKPKEIASIKSSSSTSSSKTVKAPTKEKPDSSIHSLNINIKNETYQHQNNESSANPSHIFPTSLPPLISPTDSVIDNSPYSISTSLLTCATTSVGVASSFIEPFVFTSNLLNIKKQKAPVIDLRGSRKTRSSTQSPTTTTTDRKLSHSTTHVKRESSSSTDSSEKVQRKKAKIETKAITSTESQRPSKKSKSSSNEESKKKKKSSNNNNTNNTTKEGKKKNKEKKSSKEEIPLESPRKRNVIVPAKPSLIIHDHVEVVKLIDSIYDPLFDGYRISKSEERKTNSIKHNRGELDGFGPATYGEIVPKSVPTLITLLDIREDDIFYDLGSGVGKAVIQIALQTRCKKSIGIELSESRYEASLDAKMELANDCHLGFHHLCNHFPLIWNQAFNSFSMTFLFVICEKQRVCIGIIFAFQQDLLSN